VARPSFATLRGELNQACLVLRKFTLAHKGSTQRDGAAGILRVHALSNRLNALFASGPDAGRAAIAAAAGRMRARAAQCRLDLLRAGR
jgi:hypothetical protein